MKPNPTPQIGPILLCSFLALAAIAAGPSLTIYNNDFAVVRDTVTLDLKRGVNRTQFTGATAHVEPSSVVLRDPTGKHQFQVLEQNYRGDPVSEELLLRLNEGKTIDFEVISTEDGQSTRQMVRGKIIRAGPPGSSDGYRSYQGMARGNCQFSSVTSLRCERFVSRRFETL
jgi:hypothetical protein